MIDSARIREEVIEMVKNLTGGSPVVDVIDFDPENGTKHTLTFGVGLPRGTSVATRAEVATALRAYKRKHARRFNMDWTF